MNINLIIKKEYLLQIVSGLKKEEYRDVTDKMLAMVADLDDEGNAVKIKDIKTITFFNGYHANRKMAVVEVLDIEIDNYIDDEDKETDDEYFVFILGNVLETNF